MSKQKQLKYDKAYLRIAAEWGKLSYCERKQVGAIIVKERMIISDGYNGTPTGFENFCEDDEGYTKWYVLHAEANAISKVASSTQSCKGTESSFSLEGTKGVDRFGGRERDLMVVEESSRSMIIKQSSATVPMALPFLPFAFQSTSTNRRFILVN